MSEIDYIKGEKQATMAMLQLCCTFLGYDDIDAQKRAWILEREGALIALRNICDEYGDNDWSDKLSLADIIDKHLHRNMGYK